jgi:hypothetical protein
MAETGAEIVMKTVIRSSWITRRCKSADDTSTEANSTLPTPRVVPIVGGCMRA